MAADLSRLHSFLPPPLAFELGLPKSIRDRFDDFCLLVGDQGSLCSSGSDSGLSSPLTSSEGLTRCDEDDEYLAELTRQMAYDTLWEQNDEGHKKLEDSVPAALANMPRWVDLFAASPQSTLRLPSSLNYCGKKASESPCENSGGEGGNGWDNPTAYEPRIAEISDKIEPVQRKSYHDGQNRGNHDHKLSVRWNQNLPNDGNLTKESNVRPERAPKQANLAKRKPHSRNNQWRTRRGLVQGECYVGLSLPHQQKAGYPCAAGSDTRAISLGNNPNSRTGSTGTGVFLPKTVGNPTEQGRKPRCSTVLIPARVAQALMVHFSKMSHQSRSSVVGGSGCFPIHLDTLVRVGAGPYFQQNDQPQLEPVPMPEQGPAINCNEMGLPQEWMY